MPLCWAAESADNCSTAQFKDFDLWEAGNWSTQAKRKKRHLPRLRSHFYLVHFSSAQLCWIMTENITKPDLRGEQKKKKKTRHLYLFVLLKSFLIFRTLMRTDCGTFAAERKRCIYFRPWLICCKRDAILRQQKPGSYINVLRTIIHIH